MTKFPPNLNEPIDLSDYVPCKDLSQTKTNDQSKTKYHFSRDKAMLKDLLRQTREFNESMRKERELTYNQLLEPYSPWHEEDQIPVGFSLLQSPLLTLSAQLLDLDKPWWKFW